MKKVILFLLLSISSLGYSQLNNIQAKLDSIIKEADLLYSYEKVAWSSTDLVMSLERLKNNFGGYIIYHSNDTLYASIIDESQTNRLIKYSFTSTDLNIPFESDLKTLPLNEKEEKLLKIKYKIIDQLSDGKYEIGFPEGFNPNLILLQEEIGYKLYIIMGVNEPGIIPFGNDYLFCTDLDGNINNWKKFHSRVIPVQSNTSEGEIITSATHSHLRTTPYITATDICTFKLYSPFTEITQFKVYSPGLDKYMEYDSKTNTIKILED